MALTIRSGRLADAPALARLHHAARAQAMPWLPVLHDDAETEAWMRDHVLAALDVVVACADGAPVAYLALDGTVLDQLYVAPSHQGRGIGTRLLAEAKRRVPVELGLWTFQRNTRARAFYERHGFRAVEATDGTDNEEQEPDVRYEWP